MAECRYYPIKRLKQFRQDTETFLHQVYDAVDSGLKDVYPELRTLARYLTLEEVTSGNLPKRQTVTKRARREVILVDGFITSPLDFERLKKRYGFSLESSDIRPVDAIKGRPAYRGVVRGIIRVAVRKQDFGQLKPGEILVCPMTVPTLVSDIAKAAAIVTDEGGITCHAAIIARELKKPCIIGAKIATKVLKDGDLVGSGCGERDCKKN